MLARARRGWRVLRGAVASAIDHGAPDWAAALSFYFLFALFPAILLVAALLSTLHLAGLASHLVYGLGQDLPASASLLVSQQLTGLLAHHVPGLISVGFALLLYSASQGVSGTMAALNAAYGVRETRSWGKRAAVALLLTITAGTLVGLALLLSVLGERLLHIVAGPVHLGYVFALLWPLLRWSMVLAAMIGAVMLLYRMAPDQSRPERGMLAAVATALGLWLGASALLSFYMNHFSDYNRIYGSLGAIIALMMWLYVLALALLLGAEIHAQMLRPVSVAPAPGRRAA